MAEAPRRSARLSKGAAEEEKAPKPAAPETQDIDMEAAPPVIDEAARAKELEALAVADIKQHFVLLAKSVATHETRFTARVIRSLVSVRRRLTAPILASVVRAYYTKENDVTERLYKYIGQKASNAMDLDDAPVQPKTELPEIEVYIHLLVMVWLLDQNRLNEGIDLSGATVQMVQELNRRSLDQIAAKVYFYYARFYELTDRLAEIRGTLLSAQRTATLRRDDDTQSTLINLLLRNYFHYNLYEQADKLVSKTTFPENASNNQLARFMYYLGRIKAIQLEYTESHQNLLQAVRKAPQNTVTAGFQQEANKLLIIVQLLMGDIPERSLFRQPVLRKALTPYLQITQAVRVGDLTKFQEALTQHSATFHKDKNYTLILRLRHNVIKTGIRMISLSYSRISLRDVCIKLHLDSEEDAEYIVAKAIRDGVIDATIDHEKGFMRSKENVDIYSTNEPQQAFHQRIAFCLKLHNDSVKAMRFPSKAVDRSTVEEAEAVRDQERQLVQEIQEEGDSDMEGDGGPL
ncbi:26S proteasome non-ATPase regulatory subunit [Actinomortierella ambigua]|uniref:26S proteasome regulatory subunit RPN3 n=1 Tax=Actinomortierella ambigua TaxID=1343610 RepID=A0A9P6QD39_9FUNG|nr:26S proteasome non-ATPase regulatory subunit [Actinomortierella ambigua]